MQNPQHPTFVLFRFPLLITFSLRKPEGIKRTFSEAEEIKYISKEANTQKPVSEQQQILEKRKDGFNPHKTKTSERGPLIPVASFMTGSKQRLTLKLFWNTYFVKSPNLDKLFSCTKF